MDEVRGETRLGAQNLSRSFGAVRALDEVSISFHPETIHALLGENGAGKSTLIKILSGLDSPTAGEVIINDNPVVMHGPKEAFAHGIAVVQQELALCPGLTLLENLVLGREPLKKGTIDWKAARRRAEELADDLGLKVKWDRRADSVSVATQQQVEIIRCLYKGADVLLLDEPTSVLAPSQINSLLNLLTRLRDAGTTVVLITHKLEEALAISDVVTVLRKGTVVHTSQMEDVDRAQLGHLVVGETVDSSRIEDRTAPADVVLSVDGLETSGIHQPVGPVSLQVQRHELVGLAGVAENGQDELLDAVLGTREVRGGRIEIKGRDATTLAVGKRRKLGLGYISGDRRGEGLGITESLADNIMSLRLRREPVSRSGWLSRKRMSTEANSLLEDYNVKFGDVSDPASSLSGGNQQKLVFGRELSEEPDVLIAAQPTRGVDIKGIAELHHHLIDRAKTGAGILILSQEIDELLTLTDRILVMYSGKIVAEVDPTSPDARDQLGRAMLGSAASGHAQPGEERRNDDH